MGALISTMIRNKFVNILSQIFNLPNMVDESLDRNICSCQKLSDGEISMGCVAFNCIHHDPNCSFFEESKTTTSLGWEETSSGQF